MTTDKDYLLKTLEAIERRATPHPDDTDEDRKRNLRHILVMAKDARVAGTLEA